MILILYGITITMTFIMLIKVSKIKRNDKVLYEFCNVRRTMMGYFRNNLETISKEDYLCMRKSLDLLNNNIHYFDHYKTHIFNIGFLIKIIKHAKENLNQVDELKTSSNKEVKEIVSSYEKAFLFAFFVFTPLFKTKLCIGIIVFILSLLIKAVAYVSKESATKFKNALNTIRTIEDRKRRVLPRCHMFDS